MKTSGISNDIQRLYRQFFSLLKIDPLTGILKDIPDLKFATYPYIGRDYEQGRKILFIGLDVGSDEFKDGIISLAKRQHDIGSDEKYVKAKYNPHIAGTLVSTLYLAHPAVWLKIKETKTYQEAIRKAYVLRYENPLRHVALTNFYKFVTKDRMKKLGGTNRKHIIVRQEVDLLLEEIRILSPHIILFQSQQFAAPRYGDLLKITQEQNPKTKIIIAHHPSNWISRVPRRYVQSFKTRKHPDFISI